ncbi:hypothetical protein CsatA_030935 [Cannabis sativa]
MFLGDFFGDFSDENTNSDDFYGVDSNSDDFSDTDSYSGDFSSTNSKLQKIHRNWLLSPEKLLEKSPRNHFLVIILAIMPIPMTSLVLAATPTTFLMPTATPTIFLTPTGNSGAFTGTDDNFGDHSSFICSIFLKKKI